MPSEMSMPQPTICMLIPLGNELEVCSLLYLCCWRVHHCLHQNPLCDLKKYSNRSQSLPSHGCNWILQTQINYVQSVGREGQREGERKGGKKWKERKRKGGMDGWRKEDVRDELSVMC